MKCHFVDMKRTKRNVECMSIGEKISGKKKPPGGQNMILINREVFIQYEY